MVRSVKVLICIMIFFLFSGNAEEIELSDHDVELVEPVLDHLFKFESFAYTVFADKPVSFAQISKDPQLHLNDVDNFLMSSHSNFRLHFGWNHLKKLFEKKLFPRFLLIEKQSDRFLTIIIINIHQFRRVFELNLHLFKGVLGEAMTSEKLIEEMTSDKNSLIGTLKGDERLLGIVLGYGRKSAEAFDERMKNWTASGVLLNQDLWDNHVFQPTYDQFSWLYFIQPVQFIALREDRKTAEMIKRYKRAASMIALKFQSEGLVRAVMREMYIPKQPQNLVSQSHKSKF